MELVDIPMFNRKYTWYKSGGSAKSRLDMFLLSVEWLGQWPNSSQSVLNRSIFDHCPLVLKHLNVNWGPKPFRVLDCWQEDPSFAKVVEKCWGEVNVHGWGAFVFKEKLKELKKGIKEWVKGSFGDPKVKINNIIVEIEKLDLLEDSGLVD